jgi:hypothetical protein
MTEATNLEDLAKHYQIHLDSDLELKALIGAIEDGRIALTEDDKIAVKMHQEVEVSGPDKTARELLCRRLTGEDRRVLLNSNGNKMGDGIQKVIVRMCNVTNRQLLKLPASEVRILEEIHNFFS